MSTTTVFVVQLHSDGDPEAIQTALSMIRGVARVDCMVDGLTMPANRNRLVDSLAELLDLERAESCPCQARCVL